MADPFASNILLKVVSGGYLARLPTFYEGKKRPADQPTHFYANNWLMKRKSRSEEDPAVYSNVSKAQLTATFPKKKCFPIGESNPALGLERAIS